MAYSKNYGRKTSKPKVEKTWATYKPLAYPPNGQQEAIIDASHTGRSGKVLALAGTGKTTLLRMIGEANPDKTILYLAFNRAVADAADASFPPNVKCINPHRLAFRANAKQASQRTGQYPSNDHLAALLGVIPYSFEDDNGERVTLDAERIAACVKEAVEYFCQSDDTKPTKWHVRRTHVTKRVPEQFRDRFVDHVFPFVTKAWADLSSEYGSLPYFPGRGDSVYLKLWSLSDPQLGYDMVLYDESQDANPATAHVVDIQRCQKVYVGDSNQAIYGFTGAVDALSRFEADWTLPLTKSYRFGPAVAQAGNDVLKLVPDNTLTLEGHDPIASEVTEVESPDCILCRTNAGVIENALAATEAGLNVAIAGGTKEIENFVTEAEKLLDQDAAYQRHVTKMRQASKNPVPREKYLKVKHPQLVAYATWAEVTKAVDDGDANDMATMVRIINKYEGVETILRVCANSANLRQGVDPGEWAAQPGNVMVSTAHKAKGLEWNSVKIGSDFEPPKEGKKLALPELMLIYVAVTRAKLRLDKSALHWLDAMAAEMVNGGEVGEL